MNDLIKKLKSFILITIYSIAVIWTILVFIVGIFSINEDFEFGALISIIAIAIAFGFAKYKFKQFIKNKFIDKLNMNKPIEVLDKKTVGHIEYQLSYLSNDKLFVIYKCDPTLKGTFAHREPIILKHHDEKKVRDYFEKL